MRDLASLGQVERRLAELAVRLPELAFHLDVLDTLLRLCCSLLGRRLRLVQKSHRRSLLARGCRRPASRRRRPLTPLSPQRRFCARSPALTGATGLDQARVVDQTQKRGNCRHVDTSPRRGRRFRVDSDGARPTAHRGSLNPLHRTTMRCPCARCSRGGSTAPGSLPPASSERSCLRPSRRRRERGRAARSGCGALPADGRRAEHDSREDRSAREPRRARRRSRPRNARSRPSASRRRTATRALRCS